MKFLVISQCAGGSNRLRLEPENAEAAKTRLTELISMGVVERAFAIRGGGAAYIVNAPNQSLLNKMIREHPLSLCSKTEVLPLRDFEAHEPTPS